MEKKPWMFKAGLGLMLIGAFLMWQGNVIGERTIPAAITCLIVGIGLLTLSKKKKENLPR